MSKLIHDNENLRDEILKLPSQYVMEKMRQTIEKLTFDKRELERKIKAMDESNLNIDQITTNEFEKNKTNGDDVFELKKADQSDELLENRTRLEDENENGLLIKRLKEIENTNFMLQNSIEHLRKEKLEIQTECDQMKLKIANSEKSAMSKFLILIYEYICPRVM